MDYFVDRPSIVREIWGNADTILFVFAGASAEFALNKAVDWLYFTGKLPADPLGRLFSTVDYARRIVFSERDKAYAAIDKITAIHKHVEESRNEKIPDWAYRDVLFMLIAYSISAYELLQRKLTTEEKSEVFDVFYRVGSRMNIKDLPGNYEHWCTMRQSHLHHDLVLSTYTSDLFNQYRKHLGGLRFFLLLEGQKLVCPSRVKHLLSLNNTPYLKPFIGFYKVLCKLKLDWYLKVLILPPQYRQQVKRLDVA